MCRKCDSGEDRTRRLAREKQQRYRARQRQSQQLEARQRVQTQARERQERFRAQLHSRGRNIAVSDITCTASWHDIIIQCMHRISSSSWIHVCFLLQILQHTSSHVLSSVHCCKTKTYKHITAALREAYPTGMRIPSRNVIMSPANTAPSQVLACYHS